MRRDFGSAALSKSTPSEIHWGAHCCSEGPGTFSFENAFPVQGQEAFRAKVD